MKIDKNQRQKKEKNVIKHWFYCLMSDHETFTQQDKNQFEIEK